MAPHTRCGGLSGSLLSCLMPSTVEETPQYGSDIQFRISTLEGLTSLDCGRPSVSGMAKAHLVRVQLR